MRVSGDLWGNQGLRTRREENLANSPPEAAPSGTTVLGGKAAAVGDVMNESVKAQGEEFELSDVIDERGHIGSEIRPQVRYFDSQAQIEFRKLGRRRRSRDKRQS